MKKLLRKNVSELLSLYVDGELSEHDARKVEEHIRSNANLQQELMELKQLKHLLAKKKRIEENNAFWFTLSERIASQKTQRTTLLPTINLYPVLLMATILIFIGIGYGIYTLFMKNTQQQITQISKSTLIPIFSDISKDEALQFVLFGLLPFDKEKQTIIEMNETSKYRCRIKVAKNTKPFLTQYSVHQFSTDAQLNVDQQRAIDSILTLVQERVKTSILLGENNALAIDPTLPSINRIAAASIYSTLHPKQRIMVRKNIAAFRSHRKLVENEPLLANVNNVDRHIRRLSQNRMFVVITPETLMYSTVKLNIDSLRDVQRGTIAEREHYRRRLINNFVQQDFSPLCRRMMELEQAPYQSNGILQVEVTSFGTNWHNIPNANSSQEQFLSRGLTIKSDPTELQPKRETSK